MQGIYRGNLPTEIDIQKIREAFPDADLKEGDVIRYADIEKLIGVAKGTRRFCTVVARWRRAVENSIGIVTTCVRNIGYQVQNDAGKLEMASDKQDAANRAIKRSVKLLGLIDTNNLEEKSRRQYDVLRNANAKILLNFAWKRQASLPSMAQGGK